MDFRRRGRVWAPLPHAPVVHGKAGRHQYTPAITHPEFFYGFLGVAIAWQLAFLVIARDPVRYRLMMLPAVVEKYSFGIACIVLFLQQRLNFMIVPFACIDLLLGTLFIVSYLRTPSA
ncbi:hypothetical protein NA78x_003088 [Anatilimnocola sp. NA78]|uniref:hypothetical protein n=1 Tax=Anatilimnocola sp. NA78 TaxID=3415683 RepID=UPI003CE4E384